MIVVLWPLAFAAGFFTGVALILWILSGPPVTQRSRRQTRAEAEVDDILRRQTNGL